MDVFDIIGPVMIGPSSSHTAGACRIGNYAREVLSEEPKNVKIIFSGSFAKTYKGHGTDKAVVAGLLGFSPSDIRLRDSIDIAKSKGVNIDFSCKDIELAHPNTVRIIMQKKNGEKIDFIGSSVGGGNIVITKINNVKIDVTGEYDTLIVGHMDVPGMIMKVTEVLLDKNININGINLCREEKKGRAVMIVQVDNDIDSDVDNESIVEKLKKINNIEYVVLLKALKKN